MQSASDPRRSINGVNGTAKMDAKVPRTIPLKKSPDHSRRSKYPHYLPTWNPKHYCPILGPFEHSERSKDANPKMADLFPVEAKITHLTPTTGTEISGIQLSALSSAGKDQLALLAAQRKVLAFREQDFADLPMAEVIEYCKYFGRPSVHPVGPTPSEHPDIHIAHAGGGDYRLGQVASARTTSMNWHIDGSVDPQPPGLVFLYMLECPDTGGDTVFTNTAEAYSKLSPAFQQRLHGLQAEHCDVSLIKDTRENGGVVKREGATSVHPIVRTHPVTGNKSLFNRSICHSAIFDFLDNRRRHVARVALAAEKPYETPFEEQ
ncbi:MAG: hypothetical protein Q9217_000207 [Psora testacea]